MYLVRLVEMNKKKMRKKLTAPDENNLLHLRFIYGYPSEFQPITSDEDAQQKVKKNQN